MISLSAHLVSLDNRSGVSGVLEIPAFMNFTSFAGPEIAVMSRPNNDDLGIAQALADLAKGERTATALEDHLNALEGKMDELLAFYEGQAAARQEPDQQSQDPPPVKSTEIKPEEQSR
ncbi:hypothetical protein N7462_006780 [Penicillium macrosclerotiorum]|uniref:uncharacterized protein n=1 Tax=Penicillium macrosclerotiorum TaxID=303699 RepID=UPI0025476632|nr:uncharacterized protein N7462_006780 [Penicillium macrosclerotiorum]KAJ5683615.1 hypothetical protein N7462_006780 [Penicillium macrosclerotiorum]